MTAKRLTLYGLVLCCLFFITTFRCFAKDTPDIDKINTARELLYLNKIDEAKAIIQKIDTLSFDEYEMGLFHLTFGFFQYKEGNKKNALENLSRASMAVEQYFSHTEKAELHLVFGLAFENAIVKAEASKNYQNALMLLGKNKNSNAYFLALLGAARTSPNGNLFLKDAEKYLHEHNSNRNQLLYLNTKANLTEDIQERNKLVLKSLQYFDETYDIVKQIKLFSSIALNYQILHNADSAFFYVRKVENIVTEFKMPIKKILHYYNIKAYIQSMNHQFEEALLTISKILDHGQDSPGILSQAYLRRSHIYKKQGEYRLALEDMQAHIKFQKEEFEKAQELQLGLLSIQYQLQQKELTLEKYKNRRLLSVIILLMGLFFFWIAFYYYRKRTKQVKRELEKKYVMANSQLSKQVEHNLSLAHEVQELQNPNPSHTQNGASSGLNKQEFDVMFKINHPLFRTQLNKVHPNLTASDLKYCDCMLAELTMYQTTQVLGVSESAVKKAIKKLRTIFNCSTIADLRKYLSNIEDL